MKPPYFAFCGAHCTGKTSLMNSLKKPLERKIRQPVSLITGVMQTVAERYPINERSTQSTQFAIEAAFMEMEKRYRIRPKIADRCVVDRFAYAKAHDLGMDGYYEHHLKLTLPLYDLIFFVPIDDKVVPLKENGLRSPDPKYRLRVEESMKEVIAKHKIPVHIVRGDHKERMKSIMEVVDLYF